MDRVRVLATEVTLSSATNLSKATAVRVVNDTNATIVLVLDDAAVVSARGDGTKYVALGSRNASIRSGESVYIEKDALETIDGSGLKCTKVARQ
tara:strand:- start:2075 stop:2356 length:282 start_codon:yes stop_codon:yes gene_type:complete